MGGSFLHLPLLVGKDGIQKLPTVDFHTLYWLALCHTATTCQETSKRHLFASSIFYQNTRRGRGLGAAFRKELEMYRLELPLNKYHEIINTIIDTSNKSVPSTCGFPSIVPIYCVELSFLAFYHLVQQGWTTESPAGLESNAKIHSLQWTLEGWCWPVTHNGGQGPLGLVFNKYVSELPEATSNHSTKRTPGGQDCRPDPWGLPLTKRPYQRLEEWSNPRKYSSLHSITKS